MYRQPGTSAGSTTPGDPDLAAGEGETDAVDAGDTDAAVAGEDSAKPLPCLRQQEHKQVFGTIKDTGVSNVEDKHSVICTVIAGNRE